MSVSIIAEEGKVADALSTSMFVKGLEGAEEYWKEHQDFEIIAVTEDGDIYVTEGIEDQFTLGDSFGNMELHIIPHNCIKYSDGKQSRKALFFS